MSERSERPINTAAIAVMPEPSDSEVPINTAAIAVMPEPSDSEVQA
ncbi:hypothetical protein [Nocardia asteroides]|nr:hypothetical protein [Nocardia asteroides]UGT48982.1 hypothetical protein LT345_31945 [Nocardia asteroides]SFL76657.1 hypothetical protein SAMN05444423_101832 [Nocardia asteroides]VEG31246.1 Uncharacterised protein [Nocardia asteroides]